MDGDDAVFSRNGAHPSAQQEGEEGEQAMIVPSDSASSPRTAACGAWFGVVGVCAVWGRESASKSAAPRVWRSWRSGQRRLRQRRSRAPQSSIALNSVARSEHYRRLRAHLNLSLSSHRQDQRPIHHMRERVFLHHRQIQRDRYGGTASLTTRPTLASALLHLATASMLANAALAVQCACLPGIFAVVMISFDASIITNSLLRACGCSAVALRHELLLQKACNSLADHGHSTRPAN